MKSIFILLTLSTSIALVTPAQAHPNPAPVVEHIVRRCAAQAIGGMPLDEVNLEWPVEVNFYGPRQFKYTLGTCLVPEFNSAFGTSLKGEDLFLGQSLEQVLNTNTGVWIAKLTRFFSK